MVARSLARLVACRDGGRRVGDGQDRARDTARRQVDGRGEEGCDRQADPGERQCEAPGGRECGVLALLGDERCPDLVEPLVDPDDRNAGVALVQT